MGFLAPHAGIRGEMRDTLLAVLLVGGILVVSLIFTQLFARAMYLHCRSCGTLNARRRVQCRECGEVLRTEE